VGLQHSISHFDPSPPPAAGNEGLGEVAGLLEIVKLECAPLTYADLYQLAGVGGVRALGGPEIEFRAGRRDSRVSPPEGRLPACKNCEPSLSSFGFWGEGGLRRAWMGWWERGASCVTWASACVVQGASGWGSLALVSRSLCWHVMPAAAALPWRAGNAPSHGGPIQTRL
jgi:hypothetical protein